MDLHTPLSQSYKEALSPGISPQSKVGQKSWIQVPYQFPGCIYSAACWWHNKARHTSHRHSFWQYYFTAAVLGSDCYLCALAPWVHIQQICVVVVYPPQTPLLLPWLSFCSFLHYSLPFLVPKMTLLPLCGQIFTSTLSLSSRLRYYQKSAFPAQPVYRELPFRRDRAVPSQEEAAHPEPADPAQPQRAIRGCERPGHQDPTQEMQLPQEQRVSTCAKKPTNQHR